jgi:hypothetical protein
MLCKDKGDTMANKGSSGYIKRLNAPKYFCDTQKGAQVHYKAESWKAQPAEVDSAYSCYLQSLDLSKQKRS